MAGAAAAALALFSIATPAMADAPEPFSASVQFVEPDPCDPTELMTTTLQLDGTFHDHPRNVVDIAKITATTSNGYSGSGPQVFVGAAHFFRLTQQVIATNPETNDRYKVTAITVGNPEGIVVDRFSIRCLT